MRADYDALKGTFLGVACTLLVVAGLLIVVLAGRPSNAIAVPSGYHSVVVTLSDYRISGPTSVPAGKYEFVVKNKGTVPHELVMFETKDAANALPLRKDGSVDEESDALTSALDSGSSLDPGETRVLFADLTAPGHYAMVCNLPAHYRLGMKLDLTVS
jgi:uncharacterized cupredoxin-like copper-binding protein